MGNSASITNRTPYKWKFDRGKYIRDDVCVLHGSSTVEYSERFLDKYDLLLYYEDHSNWDLRSWGDGDSITLRESSDGQHFELVNNSSGRVVDRCPHYVRGRRKKRPAAVAMLSRVRLLILVMTMMKSDAAAAEIITVLATSGEVAVLPAGPQSRTMADRREFRWTHIHLLLNKRTTRCHHERCELQSDGSLRFSQVLVQDSGNYTLEVFDEEGHIEEKKTFLLQVTDTIPGDGHVGTFLFIFLLPLLLLVSILIIFILRRRKMMRSTMSSGQTENVYVAMQGCHGNEGKVEEEERKEEEEEEDQYVPCRPAEPEELEEPEEPAEHIYM